MMLNVLQEYTAFSPKILREQTETGIEKLIMKGVLQKADTVNQNGRIYPQVVLEREVRNYQKFINERRAMGELDHPATSVVELKNVSHIVTEARMEGGVVYGTIEVLPTPAGETLRKLVEAEVKLGISSRGVGSTKDRGDHVIVQDDFQLICWDIVAEPSTPGAFIMREGRELSKTEFLGLQKHFRRSDRVFRLCNDILTR